MPLIRPMSSSGSTFGRSRWKIRNISAVQRPMPRMPTSSSMIASSSISRQCAGCTAPDWKCSARSHRYSTLRADRPAARMRGASSASTAFGASCVRRAGGQRDEAVPDRLRRLDRDLLADDRARQRREGVAAAFEPAVAEARDELLHHPVALDQVLAGVVPEVGDEVRRGMRGRHGQPFTQVVPCARVLEDDAVRRELVADRVGAREVARPLGRGARLDALGDARLVEARRPPAGRRAAPAAARRASRRGPSAARRRPRLRPRFTSAASSNSTATAIGVLKSSFIAARNAAARGSLQSTSRRRVERRPRRARCRAGAARSARRRDGRR